MVEVAGIEPASEIKVTISLYKLSLLLYFADVTPANRANKSYPLYFPPCLEKSQKVICTWVTPGFHAHTEEAKRGELTIKQLKRNFCFHLNDESVLHSDQPDLLPMTR